jgi:mono/diheme cytochrome c family protein
MAKYGLAIAAFFVVGGAAVVWQQMQPQSPAQGGSMTAPDLTTLSDTGDSAAIVQVSLPAELSAKAEIGKRVFEAKCADCHGENAAGRNGVAPPLVHKTYEPSHHGDAAFMLAAKVGVRSHHWPFGNMPPVEGLTDADMKMVVTYVRELQRANGIN